MKLIIGNKAYSSWSLRGWLACKLSGLAFEEVVVPLYDADWDRRRAPDLAPSQGRVPVLWDGDAIVVWDSLAIIEHLNEKTGGDRFWPNDAAARAVARSMAAEMHSGFAALRREHPMNVRRTFPAAELSPEVAADVTRIVDLWAEALARNASEGAFLFGGFSAADIMFAPVMLRFVTYAIPVPDNVVAYRDAIVAHPWIQDWVDAARAEDWVIAQYERA